MPTEVVRNDRPTTERLPNAPTRRRTSLARTGLLLGLTLAVVSGGLLLSGLVPNPASATRSGSSQLVTDASAATNPSYHCNAVSTHTPSALYIQLPVPAKNLTPNGTIFAALEVEVVNYTAANNGTVISFPGIFFKFPVATGGNFTMFIAPKSITINAAGWSNPALMERTEKVTAGVDFAPHTQASLTSMKVAVMANQAYGNVTIEARWHYGNTPAGKKSVVNGTWSVPQPNVKGKNLPSIFEPAPFVSIVNTTGTTMVIGSDYWANLTGTLSGERFFLEMETGGGTVFQAQELTAPVGATNFTVYISVLNYDHYLSPGLYLVHIHDQCGAMLYNKVVRAVYPPTGSIQLFFQPSTCGSITFNGTTYGNGSVANFTPSPTPYSFSLKGCKGYHFSNWTTTGALHIASGTTITVSGSGTFTIRYA